MGNEPSEIVFISKVRNTQDIHDAVKTGLSSVGNLKLTSESRIVIKPNLCCIRSHETGATTDPRVVEGIIRYLKTEFDINDIYIVESDGSQVLADMAFKLLGYENLSEKLDVKLVNLSRSPHSVKVFPRNTFLKEIRVPDIMESADVFISVPKIKTHGFCTLTATLKNQYGCNPYPKKSIYHKRINEAIVDLNVAFRPNLVVVDGIVAMEGYRGPVNGIPVRMDILIFGRDPIAIDHLVARIMGVNPNRVKHLIMAEKRGIGCSNYKAIGVNLKEVKRKFKTKPPTWHNLYGLIHHNSQD